MKEIFKDQWKRNRDIENIGKGFGQSMASSVKSSFKSTFNIKNIWRRRR